MDLQRFYFRNGIWQWDEVGNGLLFVSREPFPKVTSMTTVSSTTSKMTLKQANTDFHSVKFREVVDHLEQIRFRRHHQRRCKPQTPKVITIQDVKDVVLFLSNYKDLSTEFIRYFHIPTMDRFLRALIIYFQYFIQVWDGLLLRREESKRRIYQPGVTRAENIVRDNLGDLRVMVAREYCSILYGGADAKKFHHMNNKNNESLSEKDRILFETLISMAVRVVWIALQRKHFSLIELEMNRLLRTDIFNLIAHKSARRGRSGADLKQSPEEKRVLFGPCNTDERKLLHRSHITKELIIGEHDYRMFLIGTKQYEPSDERIEYLEIAISAPEEILVTKGVTVGLLGADRADYDAMLASLQFSTKRRLSIKQRKELPEFKLPLRGMEGDMPKKFPEEPPKYLETKQKIRDRRGQCKMWEKMLRKAFEGPEISMLDLSVSQSHVLLPIKSSATMLH